MDNIISCCGVVCSDCAYYPADCPGCPEIKGQAFWLQYTGEAICGIYACCVNQKRHAHCGQCAQLPCRRYLDAEDPTKSEEENQAIFQKQLAQLKNM